MAKDIQNRREKLHFNKIDPAYEGEGKVGPRFAVEDIAIPKYLAEEVHRRGKSESVLTSTSRSMGRMRDPN